MPNLLIDKNALIANYHYLQQQTEAGVTVNPVVKGNAYGLSADLIAPILHEAGAKLFFTAHFEEALQLKQHPALKTANFAPLNGFVSEIATARDYIAHGITPIFNSIGQMQQWRDEIGNAAHDTLCPTFLHIDTGMNRLGAPYDDILQQCEQQEFYTLLKQVNVARILSHLIASDDFSSPYNKQQLVKLQNIQQRIDIPMIVANSAGIMLGKEYHFAGVKPGVSLYGGFRDIFLQLQHVIDLEAPIIQINTVKKGESIGYDAVYIAPHDMLTATIECGYADGYLRYGEKNIPRKTRNLLIDNQIAPLIGRISMDVIIVDITKIMRKNLLSVGKMVKLIWNDYDINNIAYDTGTIPHEFLTFFSKRVKRVILS
ncbi:MAG: alanine racemase [Alphaproteobacteria bacterium]|nr:alanine racemase [Alphaproteobacteria bacterium]